MGGFRDDIDAGALDTAVSIPHYLAIDRIGEG